MVDRSQEVPASGSTPAHATLGDRIADAGQVLRDSVLGAIGFALVLVVAVCGWTASFIGLHDFGVDHMGLTESTAWLVPGTFDGAPLGLTLVVFRASIHGRSAAVWRVLIIAFTGLSSWINWQHIDDPLGQPIAAFMPPAAVILFEGLMSEARAAAARRNGRERPRLHPLRWVIDRQGTWEIYRSYVLGIELPEHLQPAANKPPSSAAPEDPTRPPVSLRKAPPISDEPAANKPPKTGAKKPASKPPKKGASKRRSMDEWVTLATPVFHAEFDRLKRNPSGAEFAAALAKAGLGRRSAQTANNIKDEILTRMPLPSLEDQ